MMSVSYTPLYSMGTAGMPGAASPSPAIAVSADDPMDSMSTHDALSSFLAAVSHLITGVVCVCARFSPSFHLCARACSLPSVQSTPAIEKRLVPQGFHPMAFGSPIETGSTVADVSLAVVWSPFAFAKNVVWDGGKAALGAITDRGPAADAAGSAPIAGPVVPPPEAVLTAELNKWIGNTPITLQDFLMLVPEYYRTSEYFGVPGFVAEAYHRLYDHCLSRERREAIVKQSLQAFEGHNQIVMDHQSLIVEVILEYFCSEDFASRLVVAEQRFLPSLPWGVDIPIPERYDLLIAPSPCYPIPKDTASYPVPLLRAFSSSLLPYDPVQAQHDKDNGLMYLGPPKEPTSTFEPGDLGRTAQTVAQLKAHVSYYRTQLKHAAGRVDRVTARKIVHRLVMPEGIR